MFGPNVAYSVLVQTSYLSLLQSTTVSYLEFEYFMNADKFEIQFHEATHQLRFKGRNATEFGPLHGRYQVVDCMFIAWFNCRADESKLTMLSLTISLDILTGKPVLVGYDYRQRRITLKPRIAVNEDFASLDPHMIIRRLYDPCTELRPNTLPSLPWEML